MGDVSEAAFTRVKELAPGDAFAFARFVQAVSDAMKAAADRGHITPLGLECFILPEPVDPLLIEARALAIKLCEGEDYSYWKAEDFRDGKQDGSPAIRQLLAALRRGMELAQVKP